MLSYRLRLIVLKVSEMSHVCGQTLNTLLVSQAVCLFHLFQFPSFLPSFLQRSVILAISPLTGNQTGYDTLIEALTSLSEEKDLLRPRLVPNEKSAYGKNCSYWSALHMHRNCNVNQCMRTFT